MNINKLRIAAGCCAAALCIAACGKGVTLENPEQTMPSEKKAQELQVNAKFDDEADKKAVENSTSASDIPAYTAAKNDADVQPVKVYSYSSDGTLIRAFDCENPNIVGNAFTTSKVGWFDTADYAPDENGDLQLTYSTECTFDNNGYILQAKKYEYFTDEDGSEAKTPISRTDYIYNPDMTIATATDWYYDANDEKMQKQAVTTYHSENGKVISSTTDTIGAGTTDNVEYAYNSNGDLISTTYKDGNGAVSSIATRRYLDNGKLAQIETTDTQGNVLYRAIYHYDSKDYLRRINYYELNKDTGEMEQISADVLDYGDNADKLGTFQE